MKSHRFKIAFCLFTIIFAIIFINQFPDYYALTKTPKGFFYSGQASWFDPWDINVYTAAIK